MVRVILKKGKEKAVRQKHPWVFSGALQAIKGKPANGEIVAVADNAENFLAYGFYNEQSRVSVRLLEWDESAEVNDSWWRSKIQNAVKARQHLLTDDTDTVRLIFSEADYLPGLIVDRYADFLSVQILTSGIERIKSLIIDELCSLLKPAGILDRSDAGARAHEGLPASSGSLLWGEDPPEFVSVKENDIRFEVNIAEGQKSGFYCDQRDNRRLVAGYCPGNRVLDCFCYSGGFTLNALKAGAAEVFSVDSSALAIDTLRKNIELNGFSGREVHFFKSDVNSQLRQFRDEGRKFDVIILDPPKYAPSRSALTKASRAYKDLNRLAMQLLEPGGMLATFSCSGAVDIQTFKQILAWAALDANREVQFTAQFCQPADHPIRSSFPEGEYLKGLMCRVI